MYEMDANCPRCHGPVEWDFTCHTYPGTWQGKETWMSCMPCDSATLYYCVAHNQERCWESCEDDGFHEGCGWRWTKGLNPNNPRAEENELNNPHWWEEK